ncbi:MAG: hydroxyacid dehydrogenase [Dethiosulfovibrio peptidovorans]|nr:MAG: hydroxyacid dehydrogenase [Dethiosulfovibrio peptidovorans]
MKVVLLQPLGIHQTSLDDLAAPLIEQGHEFVIHERNDDPDESIRRLSDADVAMIADMPLPGVVIESSACLKMISVAFTGYDHVDMEACDHRNIVVSNCAGYSTDSVAELTLGLTLAVLRKIVPADGAVRSGGTRMGLPGRELAGKTVGVVGTGAIGSRVAQLFRAFGCSVVAFSRTERPELIDEGIRYASLEELLAVSDVVTLHLPGTERTKGLLDAKKLAIMKSSSVLINTARGVVVDTQALADRLRSGDLAGAGIDVFDVEPPLPEGHSLLDAPNCVLTPHVAFATAEALEKRAAMAFSNVINWLSGTPINVVI